MPEMNIIQAVNDCLRLEMRRDDRVVVLGEDVGRFGGVFRATAGLYEEFGPDRCMDTPLAEAGIIGSAIGMALYGLKPVAEIQFADFIYPAFDQIVNELAKLRYRSGGEYPAPVVVRTPVGGGIRGGPLPLAVARGALHPHAGPQGGVPVQPRRRQGACWPRRSAARIR
jgi:2-oxoisovalerate dehydrogenase E1 component beta subunit